MIAYSPDQDTNAERFLLIRCENDRSSDYGHITAYVVRAAVPSRVDADTMREMYNDGPNAIGYRNCSWSSGAKSAVFVEDLKVHSQITKRNWSDGTPSTDFKPYGIGLRFMNIHSLEAREAAHMHNTFVKVQKKLDKLDEEFGHGDADLATFIVRVASALGIKKFLTYSKDARDFSLDRADLKVWAAKDVNWLVNNFIEEMKPKAA